MALPVIKATKFNYGAYAQPKQVKFKDPNLGIAAGIASVGKQVMQEIEENNESELQNEFSDDILKLIVKNKGITNS